MHRTGAAGIVSVGRAPHCAGPALPDGRGSSNTKQPRTLGGWSFVKPVVSKVKPVKAPRAKVKNDPKLVSAARELRDRWLEQVNAAQSELPSMGASGKYELSRQITPSRQNHRMIAA